MSQLFYFLRYFKNYFSLVSKDIYASSLKKSGEYGNHCILGESLIILGHTVDP